MSGMESLLIVRRLRNINTLCEQNIEALCSGRWHHVLLPLSCQAINNDGKQMLQGSLGAYILQTYARCV